VRDARLALAVMARATGATPAGSTRRSPGRRHLGRSTSRWCEVPGGETHPAQIEAVRQAGRYLMAAGYRVEEVLPPYIEDAVWLWHAIGSNDLFRLLANRGTR